MWWGRHANPATGAFGVAPYGATNRVMGCARMKRDRHANLATERVRGAPNWGRDAMPAAPLGP
eukprot:9382537-Pyramimonas_sp.AAC.1